MKLSGIDMSGKIRFTQDPDLFDKEVDLFKTGSAVIYPDFYTLLFFNLMNGDVTGRDDAANSIATGIYFILKDTADSVYTTTGKVKLDWFEDLNYYYVRALIDSTISPSADSRIATVDIMYTANDVDATAEKDVLLARSTALSTSKFASSDADGNGVLISMALGNVRIRGEYLITINK